MPYIYVDELPEGTEEADVVQREEYDSVVTQRDEFESQRDDALAQIEEARNQVREAKAKYADMVLSNKPREVQNTKNENVKPTSAKPITTSSLFHKED